jgi:hypothetical protein
VRLENLSSDRTCQPPLEKDKVMAVIGGGFTWYVSGNLSKD